MPTAAIVVAVVLVLVAAAGGGIALVRRSTASTTASPAPTTGSRAGTPTASAPLLEGGVSYTEPKARWTATFSGTPTFTATTSNGQPYEFAEYATLSHDQVVGVITAPAGSAFDLRKGLDGIANTGGTVISATPLQFQGHSALDGVIQRTAGSYLEVLEVDANPLIYLVVASGTTNPPADYAGLIASLQLTPH